MYKILSYHEGKVCHYVHGKSKDVDLFAKTLLEECGTSSYKTQKDLNNYVDKIKNIIIPGLKNDHHFRGFSFNFTDIDHCRIGVV